MFVHDVLPYLSPCPVLENIYVCTRRSTLSFTVPSVGEHICLYTTFYLIFHRAQCWRTYMFVHDVLPYLSPCPVLENIYVCTRRSTLSFTVPSVGEHICSPTLGTVKDKVERRV